MISEKCIHCSADVGPYDKKCGACGKGLGGAALLARPRSGGATLRSTTWSPGVAAVLSVLLPGLGQIYKGWIGKGLAFLVFTVAGYLLVFPGIALHIWAVVNAYNGESRAEAEQF